VARGKSCKSAVKRALNKAKRNTCCFGSILERFDLREEPIPLLGIAGGPTLDSLIRFKYAVSGGILVAEFDASLNFFVSRLLLSAGKAGIVFGWPKFCLALSLTPSLAPSARDHFL
jgi:hypothetical protein